MTQHWQSYTDADGRRVIRTGRVSIQSFPGQPWAAYHLAEAGPGAWCRYPLDDSDLGREGRAVLAALKTYVRD